MEDYTDSLTNVWLEQVDLVQANQTYKTLMVKLKNFSGADMNTQAKEYNDVYGQVELDYAREFDEGDIELQAEQVYVAECQKECDDALASGCQGS